MIDEIHIALHKRNYKNSSRGKDPNDSQPFGQTLNLIEKAFYRGIINGELESIQSIIQSSSNTNSLLHQKYTELEQDALLLALDRSNYEIAKYLISVGSNINSKDIDRVSPLHMLCDEVNIDLLSIAIQKGGFLAAQDSDLDTPLLVLVKKKRPVAHEVFDKIISDCAKYHNTSLRESWGIRDMNNKCFLDYLLEKQEYNMLKAAIQNGADISLILNHQKELIIFDIFETKNLDLIKSAIEGSKQIGLVQHSKDGSLLQYSIQHGLPKEIIKSLLEKQIDLKIQNCQGDTILHQLIDHEDGLGLFEQILQIKYTSNCLEGILEIKNNHGQTIQDKIKNEKFKKILNQYKEQVKAIKTNPEVKKIVDKINRNQRKFIYVKDQNEEEENVEVRKSNGHKNQKKQSQPQQIQPPPDTFQIDNLSHVLQYCTTNNYTKQIDLFSSLGIRTKSPTTCKYQRVKQEINFPFHKGPIHSVRFSPDNKYFASAGDDLSIKLWSTKNNKLLSNLEGHQKTIFCLSFSPNSLQILSGSEDKSIKVWDLQKNSCIQTIEAHTQAVKSVCYSPKGNLFASGSSDKQIKLWDPQTFECLHTYDNHLAGNLCLAFSQDGVLLASGSFESTIRIWNIENHNCVAKIYDIAPINSIEFSPDGKYIIGAIQNNYIKSWNLETSRCLNSVYAHDSGVKSARFAVDGSRVVSCGGDKEIKVWDFEKFEKIDGVYQAHDKAVLSADVTPDGKCIISGGADGGICLWNLKNDQKDDKNSAITLSQRFQGHNDSINSSGFAGKNNIITAGNDHKILIWDWKKCLLIDKIDGFNEEIIALDTDFDGKRVVCTSTKTIKQWDLVTKKCLFTVENLGNRCCNVQYSPDGNMIATGSGYSIKVYHSYTNQLIHRFEAHRGDTLCLQFSRDSQKLASAGKDQLIKIWSCSGDFRLLFQLKGHGGWVQALAFGQKNILASGSYDKTVKLWDLSTKECLWTFVAHDDYVSCLSFNPPGECLVSGGNDATVRVWDIATKSCLHTIKGHKGVVRQVICQSKFFVSVGEDRNIIKVSFEGFEIQPQQKAILKEQIKKPPQEKPKQEVEEQRELVNEKEDKASGIKKSEQVVIKGQKQQKREVRKSVEKKQEESAVLKEEVVSGDLTAVQKKEEESKADISQFKYEENKTLHSKNKKRGCCSIF